jgi:type IV pilus assembly protein PilQ
MMMSLFNSLYAARDPFHRAENKLAPPPLIVTPSGFFTGDADHVPIPDLLRQIAASGGHSVLLSSDIDGTLSAHFEHVPWEEALQAVIESQHLSVEKWNHIFWIDAQAEPLKQVRIKARIVELTDQASHALGVELHQSFGPLSHSSGADTFQQTFSTSSSGGGGQLGFNLGYLPVGFHLDLELAALEAEGSARVISSPELLVLNHEEAWIHQGKELPYVAHFKKDRKEQIIDFKKAVLSLKVTPHIVDEKQVNLFIEVNKDGISLEPSSMEGMPAIDTRQISTHVLVQDQETIALGGIIEVSHHVQRRGVSWLKDIPGLGWLSSHEERRVEKKEVIVFITVMQGASSFPSEFSLQRDRVNQEKL